MVAAAELTFDDALAYMNTVKEAFNGDPAKFKDFLNLLEDLVARRVDEASFIARVGQLFKDHLNLLPGLNDYLPAEAKIIVPPEPEQPIELSDNIKIKRDDAEPTSDDAVSYINSVKEAFADRAKFKEFGHLLCDLRSLFHGRGDPASLYARVGELFKDHPNLLAGLNAYLPVELRIFILPEPEQPTDPSESTSTRDS